MTDESRDAFHAAAKLSRAARELMQSAHHLDHPADSHSILGEVLDTMRSLESVLGQLAAWHRSTEPGRHFPAGHEESTIGIMTAVAELDLAEQQAEGLQETISRAYGGNAVVRWFDELDSPEEG